MSVSKEVLSEELASAIGDRSISCAVFTTYNFDPGFFELHVLPLLFTQQKFSEVEKVRLIQLEDCLRSKIKVATYYDNNALTLDGSSPKLGYERIPMRRRSGVFHPKLILLLTKASESDQPSLIVGCMSANLTRSGWWENIECAHLLEIQATTAGSTPCSFRNDLLALLEQIKRYSPLEDHDSMNEVLNFVRDESFQSLEATDGRGRNSPIRLFGEASKPFAVWLQEEANIPTNMNLDVISPFFDKNVTSSLDSVIEATCPAQTQIYLPEASDGTLLISEELFEHVLNKPDVHWSKLSADIGPSKSTTSETHRFVHAKIYRFWKRGRPDLTVVGSVNCTQAAHSSAGRGNIEAAFLVASSVSSSLSKSWLVKTDQDSPTFVNDIPNEADGSDHSLFDIHVRYDWAAEEVSVRVRGSLQFPVNITDLTGNRLFTVETCAPDVWVACSVSAAKNIRRTIEVSSFLTVRCEGHTWRILAQEENFSHRPSFLNTLSAEEILKYWSLLSAEQRERFITRRSIEYVEGLPSQKSVLTGEADSIFNHYAGIFHAFGRFRRHIQKSLDERLDSEADCLLFGAKYDSLPELLTKVLKSDEDQRDPITTYITFLTAKQLLEWVIRDYSWFCESDLGVVGLKKLQSLIEEGLKVRDEIQLSNTEDSVRFLAWFEEKFLEELGS